jgi:D-3-phosphoglycerate dehydrogenase
MNRGRELGFCTVGIIGYGNMGSSFARKLSGFGCKVLAYDKYNKNYSDDYAKEVSLDDIFANADVLSLHVPLTAETKYMVDDGFIASFKNPFVLLNASRGPVVKTSALVSALQSGKIVAAGLDVIEFEETSFEATKKMTDNPDFRYLAQCDNVIMSPHIAGWTVESKIKLAQVLLDKILKIGL